ncbi:ABC transporter permease [Pacificibacter marinus]|uniref:Spermidine/putrescine transport system permease protein PotB n=1 Tax=Pacificibacter marinus TaxID=658057 RepID=A0A1Y5SRJ2_9RHOB|nr:ABC transporter permease subunit [Pacificibacter marinus]SEK66643.1 putative spermidine/putrescine transport system permease protein [Pacificibacter marinus]SLN46779.1 Spermidine/putrescine transport system permease protein PotB [Pacificibacter marinus]
MTWRRCATVLLLLMPGLGLIVSLIGMVVYVAIAQSFGLYNLNGDSVFTVAHWAEMLDRKLYTRAVTYSIYIGVWSAILAVAFAYPLAIWLRKPFRGSIIIGAILKAPLLVQGLVAAFLFINVISYHGIFNQLMQAIGLWDEPRRLQNDRGAIGVLFLQTWKNMPFALLLLTGAVQAIPDDVLDAARDMGAGTFARFRKIIAPLSLSAMQAALVIIFIGAVADFSFQVIAGPTNRQSLAQLMVFVRQTSWHEAAVVGVTLMVIALAGSLLLAIAARLILKGPFSR